MKELKIVPLAGTWYVLPLVDGAPDADVARLFDRANYVPPFTVAIPLQEVEETMEVENIWLYRCILCGVELATKSMFPPDGNPPVIAIECVTCEGATMSPVRFMTRAEFREWAAARPGGKVRGRES